MAKLLLSAGMPRSASTWVYNVIRLLILNDSSRSVDFSFGWIDDKNSLPETDLQLIKVHAWDNSLAESAELIVYSYRDVRDAIASAKRKFDIPLSIELASGYINLHEKWMSVADLAIKYEDFILDEGLVLKRLCAFLEEKGWVDSASIDIDVVAAEIEDLFKQSEQSNENSTDKKLVYDKGTLVHPKHKTDGNYGTWRNEIDPDLQQRIATKFEWWFNKYDYEI